MSHCPSEQRDDGDGVSPRRSCRTFSVSSVSGTIRDARCHGPLEAAPALAEVLEDKHNNDEIANNDQYKVAPLVGWKWGYEIVYADQGLIGVDEPDEA